MVQPVGFVGVDPAKIDQLIALATAYGAPEGAAPAANQAPAPAAEQPVPVPPEAVVPEAVLQTLSLTGVPAEQQPDASAALGGPTADSSMYSTMPQPVGSLPQERRPAAQAALAAAAAAAKTPQGISTHNIPGFGLEERILLGRLLGHDVSGSFDEVGQLQPSSREYWGILDRQLESHTPVKHMFESTWYKCGKLNADLVNRAANTYDMEVEALQHILNWLGLQERQLPRPGEAASFDELVAVLDMIGARARLVTDPVPFLTTTTAPLDRNGMPLMIHMTFKDKGQFARHHILSLASWAKENPDHAILMYDDDDLQAYLGMFEPSVLALYSGLKTAVERSDLWRYVVMCRHGGVYTDADTLCVRPIQVMFGVEDVFKRDPLAGGSGWGITAGRFGIQFEQWTLAGAPHHPVYCNMHNFISKRILEEVQQQSPSPNISDAENWSILHRTGPHVWTDSVLKWMHGQGIGFHEALVQGARLEEVYAMHMFRGVWRKRLDSGDDEQHRKLLVSTQGGFGW
eukprot:gene2194-2512_t